MALIDDDEVKKIRSEGFKEAFAALVLSEGLINGEVHLPALDDLARRYLVAGIAEASEDAVFRIIDQDIAVGKIKDFRPAVLACAIPSGILELPADLKRDRCFPRARGHRDQKTPLSF